MSEPLSEQARRRLLASAAPLLDEAALGVLVQGRYRLVRELGRGGMGVVWEARDEELGREVALKLLSLPPGSPPELRERFLREARSAARLSHPGIAAVFDADERAIAMQLVRGRPLSAVPAPEPREAARWIRDAALAVHYAHERGVVHRDLKPHNLLLEGERVLVTDFGLAKDALAGGELSTSGGLLGTPSYMAPEQARGGAAVDARSDVWGLGATLYDLLCGRPPFVGGDVLELLRRIDRDAPPAPGTLRPGLSRDLELVLGKALEKDPGRRYASARALADDLHRWLEGLPVLARAPTWRYRAARFAARHRVVLALASVSVLASAVALGTWLARRAATRASDSALALSNEVSAVLDDAEKHRQAGEVEHAHERLDDAIAVAHDLVARHDIASGHYLLGRLLASRGRREEALAAFDRALELNPRMSEARIARGLARAREAARHAAQAAATGEAEPVPPELVALRAAALADLRTPAVREGGLTMLDALKVRAELAQLAGDLQSADELWQDVLRFDPVHAEAKLARSQIAVQRGDGQAAWALAMSALDVQRGFAPAYLARGAGPGEAQPGGAGFEPARLEDVEGVLVDLGAQLATRPSDALARGTRAQVHARSAARAASAQRPSDALAAWADAIEELDAALLLEPELAGAWSNRGLAHAEREQILLAQGGVAAASEERRAALADFDEALRLAPGLAPARLNRALLRTRMAREERAAGRAAAAAEYVLAARADLISALGLVTSAELRGRLERELAGLGTPGG